MIVELRKKSQITLPKEIVKKLNLEEGDTFDVSIENGVIKLEPVAIYKVQYISQLVEEVQMLREEINSKYKSSNDLDELMKSLVDKE